MALGKTLTQLSTTPLFPFLDLQTQFASIRDEVMAAINRVMESQRFILGPEVEALEQELAAKVGVPFGIGCASGSDALLLALRALDIGPGDEVITTPFTFVATVGSIVRLGARPIFIDIDPKSFNLDVSKLAAAVTNRTRAVIPVHLFGLMAEMDPIVDSARRHGYAVIEDAAQAIGSKHRGREAGSIGVMGCFSFFPSKNLGGAGDGGLITTRDPELAERLKILRTHGSRSRYSYELIGMNSRLDALQAAILRVKLAHLGEWEQGRVRNAHRYSQLFAEAGLEERLKLPVSPAHCHHVYNQFTVRSSERDRLREHLKARGLPTEIYYPFPLHLQPAFAYLGYKPGDFPESERASREVLSLPIYPELKDEHVVAIVEAIGEFYAH
jgi:dTDP-4-amino-4,6-dideoxygalactose transaminase